MIIAIDYGTKRIGLAISDQKEEIAFTLSPIIRNDRDKIHVSIDKVADICRVNNVRQIVLGIPNNGSNSDTTIIRKIKQFAKYLKTRGLELTLWDESFTSKIASVYKKNKRDGKIDSESARIILQEYLDYLSTSRNEKNTNL